MTVNICPCLAVGKTSVMKVCVVVVFFFSHLEA